LTLFELTDIFQFGLNNFMQPERAVIVYHSQSAANTDMFIQSAYLWTYEHWYVPVIAIAAIALWAAVVNRR
jgi:hypothetical protein